MFIRCSTNFAASKNYCKMKRIYTATICMMVAIATCAQSENDSILTKELAEFEVTAVKKFVVPTDRGIKISMSGSPLADIGNAIDAIRQMPLIDASDGSIKVIGKGQPAIYINGHLMRDTSELDIITSKDLESVEVITNPSSKYGPEVSSVILIKTRKRVEGLYANIAATASVSEKISESAKGSIGYRMDNGLYVFGDFSLGENRFRQTRHYSEKVLDTEMSGRFSDSYATAKNRTRSFSVDGGMIYDFGKHSVGAKYTFSGTPLMNFKSNLLTDTDMLPIEEISSTSSMSSQSRRHYLNSFLQMALAKSCNLRVDVDYIHNRETSKDIADQYHSDTQIATKGRTQSDLFGAKVEVEKTFEYFNITIGGDYTYTDHKQDFSTDSSGDITSILQPATDDVAQHLYSGFLSFEYKLSEIWRIFGGLRYDGTQSKYIRNGIYESALSKTYSDLLPDIGLQFRSPVTMSLSYRQTVYRPNYSSLSNNYRFVTPTHWETGNPELLKMKAQMLRLNLSYKGLMFQAEATHYDRKIGLICRYYPEIKASVSETVNLPSYNMFQLVAVQQFDVRRWHPTLQGVLVLQDLKFGSPHRSYTTPFYQLYLNNRFDLPHAFYAYLSFFVRGNGNIEAQYCRASWQTALTISKSFGHWNFSLVANDIFGTWRQKVMTHTDNVKYSSAIKGASQYISLSVRYQFKTAKKSYNGKSVRSDEIDRL